MNVIVLDSEAYEALKTEIKGAVKLALREFLQERQIGINNDWISQKEAQSLLPYRSKTSWQKFRDTGAIVFSQSGRKIMYSRSSIMKYLNSNIVKF
jgi:hypothetical protein